MAGSPWQALRRTALCPILRCVSIHGGVLILAPLRRLLARGGLEGLYLTWDRMDVVGHALLAEVQALIVPFLEPERLSTMRYGTSDPWWRDGGGWVVLAKATKIRAGIKHAAPFVRLSNKFQAWAPNRFRSKLAEPTQQLRAPKKELGARREASKRQGAQE